MARPFLKIAGRTVNNTATWAAIVGIFLSAIANFFSYGQMHLAAQQLELANDQRRWQNYNEMNSRYAGLYQGLPEVILSGCVSASFPDERPEVRRWVRQYFDLYSEEYWLYQQKLIPNEMWTHRIHGGVRVNLHRYPMLIQGYHYWREHGAFKHPSDFADEVSNAIADVQQRLKDEPVTYCVRKPGFEAVRGL